MVSKLLESFCFDVAPRPFFEATHVIIKGIFGLKGFKGVQVLTRNFSLYQIIFVYFGKVWNIASQS